MRRDDPAIIALAALVASPPLGVVLLEPHLLPILRMRSGTDKVETVLVKD